MTPTSLGSIAVLNTTPHVIRFAVGAGAEIVEAPPCGVTIDARAEQETVRTRDGVAFLRTAYRASPEGFERLERIEREFPGVVVVGSVIAAQAYPGRVFALIAVPGLERVPVEQKLCRADAFGTFEG